MGDSVYLQFHLHGLKDLCFVMHFAFHRHPDDEKLCSEVISVIFSELMVPERAATPSNMHFVVSSGLFCITAIMIIVIWTVRLLGEAASLLGETSSTLSGYCGPRPTTI